jgi:hypothetical protein
VAVVEARLVLDLMDHLLIEVVQAWVLVVDLQVVVVEQKVSVLEAEKQGAELAAVSLVGMISLVVVPRKSRRWRRSLRLVGARLGVQQHCRGIHSH